MFAKNNKIRDVMLLILIVFTILLLLVLQAPFSYIWVMDNGQNLNKDFLIKLCPNGTRLVEIQFGSSGAIGADPNTGFIWAPELGDRTRENEDQLLKFDRDGNLLNRYQGYRSEVIALDPNDGNVWVGLVNEHLVVKLNPEGEQILAATGVQTPYAIAVDPRDSSIWVADGGNIRHLVHFSAEGEELFRVPTEGFFSNAPHQLAVDPQSGNIWYTGSFVERVYLRSARGELLKIVEGFDSPVAIAVDPIDNSAWVADFSRHEAGGVIKLDARGDFILKKTLDSPPWSVGVNPFDNTVWVGLEDSLVVLTKGGELRSTFQGYFSPQSLAFVGVRSTFPARLEYIRSCLIKSAETEPRRFLKPTLTSNPAAPILVTPSPVPTYTPTATPLPSPTAIATPTSQATSTADGK